MKNVLCTMCLFAAPFLGNLPAYAGPPALDPLMTADIFAPGRSPQRFGPIDENYGVPLPSSGFEIVPILDDSQGTFILTHLHVFNSANNSSDPLVSSSCRVYLRTTEAELVFATVAAYIPVAYNSVEKSFFGTFETFWPLKSGEGISVICIGKNAAGDIVSQFSRATALGYFVPTE